MGGAIQEKELHLEGVENGEELHLEGVSTGRSTVTHREKLHMEKSYTRRGVSHGRRYPLDRCGFERAKEYTERSYVWRGDMHGEELRMERRYA